MKQITIEYVTFREMKDKMVKVLANLEDIVASKDIREGSKEIHKILEVMIGEMTGALKLATGKIHDSDPEIIEIPKLDNDSKDV